ncbi:MAG: hypothetical protein H6747_07440 [Deltaproteobacteria bacterium]|nr:hypothetical protein [Deltaproteobacteria bacterium]
MSDAKILRSHLESEVVRLHKERRSGLIFGALMVLIVAGYMTWLDRQFVYWTKPDNMAMTATGLVEAYIPSMKRSASETVRTEAPALARYVGDSVSAEVPRLVREMIASMISQYSDKLADYAVDRYTDAFKSIIDGARTDIAKAIETDSNQEQERLVVVAIEKQIDLMSKQVAEGSLTQDPLYAQIEASHQALANLNGRLGKLIAKSDKSATRKDKLTKRFLGTFWRFVQQENPDVKASDSPKAGK